MEISVADAADLLDVSQQRVRALVGAGRIRARKVGGRWLVDGASLPSAPRRGRPMSVQVAWEFLTDDRLELSPEAAYRRRRRRLRLLHDSEPERLLASWVASRARRQVFHARRPEGLLEDFHFVPSGVCDPRAGLAAGAIAEGYVSSTDVQRIRRAHLLRPAGAASNVVLHVAQQLPSSPVPRLMLAADLAEHDQPRELARARELIRAELAA